MPNDMNRVLLIGRLTRDPELRHTQGGTSIANFTIASNRNYTTNSGEKREEVYYFDCVAWAKGGEIIVEYCKKGSKIAVEGRLHQNRWEDQSGNKRSRVEIVVDNFQFLDSKGASSQTTTSNSLSDNSSLDIPKSPDPVAPADNPFSDDEVPF